MEMWEDFLRLFDSAYKLDFSVSEELECSSCKDLYSSFFSPVIR